MNTLIIDSSTASYSGNYTRMLVNTIATTLPSAPTVIKAECEQWYAVECLKQAERVIIVGPVYWGRLPAAVEGLLDRAILPNVIYKFVDVPILTGLFGIKRPTSLVNVKEWHCVLSYGSPRIAMLGVPFFRLGFMIGKLFFKAKIRHWPTYLVDTSKRNRKRTMRKLKRYFRSN